MKKTRKKILFAALPRDFAGLCRVHTPRPIRDAADYENTVEIIDAMVLWEKQFTRDQEDYFDVLCTLVERYDEEHTKWPSVAPLEMLKNLLDEHQMSAADLSRLLGASRQLGPMILRGERNITADHARLLGAHFKLAPGAFL
jgi:HTH-type transcriptional regulator/antitoxin HigA